MGKGWSGGLWKGTKGSSYEKNNVPSSAGKNDPHGDSGRAKQKAQKQIEELEKKLKTTKGREADQIKKTIKNIRRIAEKRAKGETHWRR